MSTHKVEIVERATQEVVETLAADDEAQAERIRQGVAINLNHLEYQVRVVAPAQEPR